MKNDSGTVVFELLGVLFFVLLAFGANLELVRRAKKESYLHHLAFLLARQQALGESEGAVLRRHQKFVLKHSEYSSRFAKGLEAKIYHRFPALYRFPVKNGTKHSFEVTRLCLFPFSY